MRPTFGTTAAVLLSCLLLIPALDAAEPAGPVWLSDYTKAMSVAEQQGKMLLVFFYKAEQDDLGERFQSKILADPTVVNKLQAYVCTRVPVDAAIQVKGKRTVVLEHAAFKRMHRQQGVAILDFVHKEALYYGCVVSAFPLAAIEPCSARQMLVILDLPPGTPDERMRSYESRIGKIVAEDARSSQASPPSKPEPPIRLSWHTDYAEAMNAAERQGKMLLILFCTPGPSELCDRFESETLSDRAVCRKLQPYVRLRLPLDAGIVIDGEEVKLIDHPAFGEMHGRPGLAIIDFARKKADYYGNVVSIFPLTARHFFSPERMLVILELPSGTLTQRTLIYAVRTHPERPASTDGQLLPDLAEEAQSHSEHQAEIRLQGHHRWGWRFRRILGRLPGGRTASEVCAESWPGEDLFGAAIECVRSWRLSSGHWGQVRARHRFYGYDMKRGSNGIWYATGIFGGT